MKKIVEDLEEREQTKLEKVQEPLTVTQPLTLLLAIICLSNQLHRHQLYIAIKGPTSVSYGIVR